MSASFLLPGPRALRRARGGEALLVAVAVIVVALFMILVSWQESRLDATARDPGGELP
jgi:cytochrome oxidase assembly protein ShyY1